MAADGVFPMVCAALIMAILVLGLSHPGIRATVIAHGWQTRVAGALVAVGGLLGPLLLAPSFDPLDDTGGPWTYAALLLVLVGVTLVTLPSALGRFVRDREQTRQAAPALKTMEPDGAAGWEDGLAALRAPFENPVAALRIIGPWAALTASIWIAIAAQPADQIKSQPVWLSVLMLGGGLLVPLIAVPTVAVAWHRFIGANRLPRTGVALPDRSALGYMRRLGLALSLVGAAIGGVAKMAPEIAGWLHMTNVDDVTAVLEWIVRLAGLALAGQFALVLPAVAMKDRRVTTAASAMATRKLFPGYLIGLAVAVGPLLLLLGLAPSDGERWTGPGVLPGPGGV